MALDRKSRVLGPRVVIPGTSASIQPPKRFRLAQLHRNSAGSGQFFLARWEPYQRVFLAAWQINDHHGSDASLVCAAILGEKSEAQAPGDFDRPFASAVKMIGSANAIEKRHSDGKRIVRVASLGAGRWFAIELSIAETTIDDPLYRAFDLACQSVRFSSQ